MNRLVRYVSKYKWYYIAPVIAMIISIALDMFNPHVTKVIIDEVILKGKMDMLQMALLSLAGITISRAILGYAKELLFDIGSSKVVIELRKELFDHIQKQAFSFFDKINTGELMSRVTEDVENIWKVLGFGFMLTVEQAIYFTVATVLLFTLSWKLAIVSLLTMPVIAYLAFKLEKKIEQTYEKISDQVSVLNTTAQENIAGVRLVKAFGRERHEIQKFLDQNIVNYDLNVEQARVWSRYYPKIEFLSSVTVVLVTAIGGWLVIGEEMTVGTLVAFSNYIFMLIWPMRMLGWLTNLLSQCRASIKKLDVLFHEVPAIINPENAKVPVEQTGHVVFENVSFSYNGVSVLKNITIDAKPGSTIAIMGTTGSGKSSIVNLIGRFYDCESGTIKVDGVDVKQWDLLALRAQVAVVAQDTFLFSDSIEENIKFGSKEDNTDIWMAAARDAKVHDYVMEMNEGYETMIGERGVGLSGGQKQRISIARALAKNSKILILDDATSALDMETEYEIQKSIEDRKAMTKFIIAHRISAVKNADEILIVEDGEIVERGTHKGLLEKKGKYYDTYCAQFNGVILEQDTKHTRKRRAKVAQVLQEEVV